jgi:lysozyme
MDLDKLQQSIELHEGLRLLPYVDTTGHITIGYGRNLTDKGISNAEASDLLSSDIQDIIEEIRKEPWWPNVATNDARSRACVEMVFNLGLSGFRSFTNAIGLLEADDFDGAAEAFMESKWALQVGYRAKVLTQMIATGDD